MGINLREKDFTIFKKALVNQFTEERFKQIKQDFPCIPYLLLDNRLYDYIQLCFEKSEAFGFNQRGSAKLYIDLCFIYGLDFINDPQYSWINTALNETKDESQIYRATDLFERYVTYNEEVEGADQIHLKEFNSRFQKLNLDTLAKYNKSNAISKIRNLLAGIYPEKFNKIEPSSINAMIQEILNTATTENINFQNEDILILALMMFLFGHGFNKNPMYTIFSNNNEYVQSVLKQSQTKITSCWLINSQLFYKAYTEKDFQQLQKLTLKG